MWYVHKETNPMLILFLAYSMDAEAVCQGEEVCTWGKKRPPRVRKWLGRRRIILLWPAKLINQNTSIN